jgi:aminomethyltransferase
MPTVARTPLAEAHEKLGARMAPFAGYAMPIQYQGVIAESKAVREGAGMFDVSHMARLRITGPRALEFVEWITSNDVAKLTDGTGQYSLLPNERGGCVDDVILYRIGPEEFLMVVNAANHAKDVAWIESQNRFEASVEDETDATAMIAVQGPRAAQIVADLGDAPEAVRDAPLFGVVNLTIAGVPCVAARSGYTGEDGFEIICPARAAEALWDALLGAGVVPCGLGARDVLRVEAGLPLYGHELGDDLSPIAAGLGWVISKKKNFVGAEPIARVRAEGPPRKLQGVRLDGKRLPVPGMKVLVDGAEVGEVTSGVFSPTLDCGIAFAFVDAVVPLDTPCVLDMRGKPEHGTIVSKRFLR